MEKPNSKFHNPRGAGLRGSWSSHPAKITSLTPRTATSRKGLNKQQEVDKGLADRVVAFLPESRSGVLA